MAQRTIGPFPDGLASVGDRDGDPGGGDPASDVAAVDLRVALARLDPRDREVPPFVFMLWTTS